MKVLFRLIGLGICMLLVSCDLEPDTPIVKPAEFDKYTYNRQIRMERDSLTKQKRSSQKKTTEKSDTARAVPIASPETPPDTIPLKIVYGKAKIDTLMASGKNFVFVFDSDTANKLYLKVSASDTVSDPEIKQIRGPGNSSEGPFGTETIYHIREKGLHQVTVSEKQTSGKPRQEPFSFEVKLGW